MYENYSLPTVQVDIQEWLPLIRHSLGSYMENYPSPTAEVPVYGTYPSPTVQVLIYGKLPLTQKSSGTRDKREITPYPQFRYWYMGNYCSPTIQVPIYGKLSLTGTVQVLTLAREITRPLLLISRKLPRGGTPYIRMIGVTVVFFRGWNRRFGIF